MFPRTLKVDYGHEESAETFGNDPRVYSISGKEFIRDEKGNLKGIRTVEVENFEEIKGTEKDWEADLILLAMGFLGPEHYVSEPLNIDLDERSNQPMNSEDKRYKLIYNGEIYNHLDIRRELENHTECKKEPRL